MGYYTRTATADSPAVAVHCLMNTARFARELRFQDVRKSAGCTALDGLFQNGFLVDGLGQELVIHIVEAQPGHGVRKPLAGEALVPEQEDGPLHHVHDLFLRGKDLGQR